MVVSLNSRLESNKEEKRRTGSAAGSFLFGAAGRTFSATNFFHSPPAGMTSGCFAPSSCRVPGLRTTTLQKCAAVPRRARI